MLLYSFSLFLLFFCDEIIQLFTFFWQTINCFCLCAIRCDTIHGWLICIWWASSPPPPPPSGSQMVPWMGGIKWNKVRSRKLFQLFLRWPFCIVWVCGRHVLRFFVFLFLDNQLWDRFWGVKLGAWIYLDCEGVCLMFHLLWCLNWMISFIDEWRYFFHSKLANFHQLCKRVVVGVSGVESFWQARVGVAKLVEAGVNHQY